MHDFALFFLKKIITFLISNVLRLLYVVTCHIASIKKKKFIMHLTTALQYYGMVLKVVLVSFMQESSLIRLKLTDTLYLRHTLSNFYGLISFLWLPWLSTQTHSLVEAPQCFLMFIVSWWVLLDKHLQQLIKWQDGSVFLY